MKRTNIDATQLELADTVVAIKRVSKTVKGGRTMRFSALVVVGDKNGHVGVGMGKAAEIPEAIRKGKQAAEKNMITVPLDENKSIPHDFIGKFGSASVLLKKSPEGTGIIAGGPARSVLEFATTSPFSGRSACSIPISPTSKKFVISLQPANSLTHLQCSADLISLFGTK